MIETFAKAGLSPRHLSALLKISRVAASRWMNGHADPHPFIRPKVEKLAALVDKALAAGDLPLPDGMKKPEELHYLRSTLARHGNQ